MRRAFFRCLLLLFVLPSLEAAKLQKKGRLTGKLTELTYTAPNKLFQINSPVDPDFGGHIEDGAGFVSFTDDFGRLYKIEYMPISADAAKTRATLGDEAFFNAFLQSVFLPNTIWKVIPKTKLVSQDFTPDDPGPLLFTWMLLTQGSVYTVQHGSNPPEREDAYRGIAIFARPDTFFVVSGVPSGPETTIRYKDNPNVLRENIRTAIHKLATEIRQSKSKP